MNNDNVYKFVLFCFLAVVIFVSFLGSQSLAMHLVPVCLIILLLLFDCCSPFPILSISLCVSFVVLALVFLPEFYSAAYRTAFLA